jgi:hypothetical protein
VVAGTGGITIIRRDLRSQLGSKVTSQPVQFARALAQARTRDPRLAWATSQPAFDLVTFASVAEDSRAYTIALFQSNESFRYFEPSMQRTNSHRGGNDDQPQRYRRDPPG